MGEWERYWRIMQWNRLADSRFDESDEIAMQCRTAWKQIVAVVPQNSQLPKEFLYPLRGFMRGDQNAFELFEDNRRLILCISDLRDYLELMQMHHRV